MLKCSTSVLRREVQICWLDLLNSAVLKQIKAEVSLKDLAHNSTNCRNSYDNKKLMIYFKYTCTTRKITYKLNTHLSY